MEDKRRKADALSSMSPEVGIKVQQDPISICAVDANQIAGALATMMDKPKSRTSLLHDNRRR